ncbi:MAG TPA: hypothetical protein PK054_09880 [Anaerohalosphaeraceae bacterium]|nr:hypothetical protein [Anaerohalosphaeraceae bacterium]HOL89289.1 hypothetical protein [Anaerohalosphaeraceae bacterium]HPP56873.1 hypothetical protein [Anaerohalosphaeraceae bacterium]
MNDTEKRWRQMRDEYLQQIEAELTSIQHPRKKELLADIREHLERRYEELDPSQRTDSRLQEILEEMGPAEEYAELLKQPSSGKTELETVSPAFRFLNHFLTGVFVIVLVSVVGYKLHTADIKPQPDPLQDFILSYQPDPQIIGRWNTVDFVETPEQFVPDRRRSGQEFFFKEIEFYKDMKTSRAWLWSKGKLYFPDIKKEGEYRIRMIDGQEYLFLEWLPDQNPQTGRSPYYVLEKENPK